MDSGRIAPAADLGVYSGTATLVNSTLAGNSATLSGGGAINSGTATFSSSTVAANTATTGGVKS